MSSNGSLIRNCPEFEVIDENDDVILVSKAAPLLVHPTKPGGPTTLLDGLKALLVYELANGGQISMINRLDRETSGLMLIAKNAKAARRYGLLMQKRRIHKTYQAIVWGWPEREEFEVDAPMRHQREVRGSRINLKQCIDPGGATALTRFKVLRRFTKQTTNGDQFSLVEAYPISGRLHQIRLHLQVAGHSVIGDKIYGPSEDCYLEFIEKGWSPNLENQLLFPRHALHSIGIQAGEENWMAPLDRQMAEWIEEAI